jgi:hypothetical protein
MKRSVPAILVTTILTISHAEWNDSLETFSGHMQSIGEGAKELWDRQSQRALEAIGTEADSETKVYESAKQRRFHAIWEDVIEKLDQGLRIDQKIQKAPDYALIGEDKKSLQGDLDALLDELIALILNEGVRDYRGEIRATQEKIASLEGAILSYREKRVSAPDTSALYTTRTEYSEKIANTKEEIALLRRQIVTSKMAMRKEFSEQGIEITAEQMDILLSRVDGDDIIRMVLVMDVLGQITEQLSDIMQESHEELSHAKKYYGMHMVLLGLVVYIQDQLIEKIENLYLPKITAIIDETQAMLYQTDQMISSEENLQRRNIYYQNYTSQQLTLETAMLYQKNLIDQQKQIQEAISVSKKNLALSKNTYQTVTLSQDLHEIISDSQLMMQEVMRLQMPTIIPFENLQIQHKYKELTEKIRR